MSNETLLPCSVCDGTGDQRGNPKFPPCEFCNGTGLRNRAAPPSPVPQEVEEALKAVDWVVSEQDQNIPVEHAETLAHYIRSLSSPAPVEGLPVAAHDVLAERERQKEVEGWTEAHDDDQHQNCELAEAASGYIQAYLFPGQFKPGMPSPAGWPWNESWWKPKDQRRNLVRAGALIIAEIERIDRAALTGQAKKGG